MDRLEIGMIGIGVVMTLIFCRVPIGVALGLPSFFGIWAIGNVRAAAGTFSTPYHFLGDWTLSAIPMFLLMGFIASSTGLTSGLFNAIRLFMSRIPGGLASASVLACALFSSASGSSVATAAALSRIAVPEMLKARYNPSLASGTIAAAGTLGSLIPPSILAIIYGVFAEQSIGKLFAACIIPGILSAIAYIVMITIRVKLNPSLAPDTLEQEPSRAEKVAAIKDLWTFPVLVFGVLGGIFAGIFSPTEGGAIGAFLAAVLAFLRGSLTRENFGKAIFDTVVSSASLFFIVIGAVLFTKFMALAGVPSYLSGMLASYATSPLLVILLVAIIYLILGMFIDAIGLMLLTLPIVVPIAGSAGIDLIWFGVILIKLLEMGLVTPPVGLNVYVVKSSLGNLVSLSQVFRGVWWFLVMDVIVLVIIFFWPETTLYMPKLIFG